MKTMKQAIKPKDREIARKLLSRAYARIKDGRSYYVCYALDFAANGRKEERVASALQTHIHKCLGSWCFVTSWLGDKEGIDTGLWTDKQCAEYRMAWIQEMSAQLK